MNSTERLGTQPPNSADGFAVFSDIRATRQPSLALRPDIGPHRTPTRAREYMSQSMTPRCGT
jgi:hypothetical protein